MKSIGNRLSQRYVSKGIIEPHFCNVYSYIFDYMFNFILYNLSLLILGFILKQHIAAIVYVIIVGSLRAVAGGYHCKTRTSCYILSYTIFTLYLYLITIIPKMSAYILICIYIINWSSILIISPVDTPNKIFDSNDKKISKKGVHKLFIFNSIFTILSFLLHWNKGLLSIDLSLIICSLSLYTGYISNTRRYL